MLSSFTRLIVHKPPWEKATSPKYCCSMKYLNSESVDFTFISIFVCFSLCGRTFSHYSNKGIRIQPQGIFYLLLNMVSGFSLQFFHIVLQGFLDTLLHAGDLLLSCYEQICLLLTFNLTNVQENRKQEKALVHVPHQIASRRQLNAFEVNNILTLT